RPAAIAVPAFLVACTVGMGGLATSKYPQDVTTYARYGRLLVLDGKIPYHDFYFEYPPGAVPVFALPALIWNAHYHIVFQLLIALIRIWRTKGRDAAVKAGAVAVAAAAAVFAFFAATGPGGLGFSFWTQAKRHLQIESLGSSLLLAADKLGLYRSHWIAGKPSS